MDLTQIATKLGLLYERIEKKELKIRFDTSLVMDVTDNPKNAALYFNHVVPLKVPRHMVEGYDDYSEFLEKLYPECVQNVPDVRQTFLDYLRAYSDSKAFFKWLNNEKCVVDRSLTKDEQMQSIKQHFNQYFNEITSSYEQNVPHGYMLHHIAVSLSILAFYLEKGLFPVFTFSPEAMKSIAEKQPSNSSEYDNLVKQVYDSQWGYIGAFPRESFDVVSLKLANIPLIDTKNVKWEHIIQFREDKESVSKLRKLRLFFHENYSGKGKNYIQDDLSNRIDEYKNISRDWGFDTLTSSLTLVNTSVTSVGASLVMALTGQPLDMVAATGISVAIANVALHVAKERYNLIKIQRDHPLSYIIEAKNDLEKN